MTAYVPILATDEARLDGLAATPDAAKGRLTPLFDATAPPRGRRLEAHLDALVDAVAHAFGPRPALVDAGDAGGERGDDCARTADGRVHLAYLLDAARARGLALAPVTGLRRPDAYQLAVADAAGIDRRGVALRLQRPDFRDRGSRDAGAVDARALATLDALGVAPEETDLVLDFGGVTAGHLTAYESTGRAALAALTRDTMWRSVTIAAATQLAADARGGARGPRAVPRTDWLLWCALTRRDGAAAALRPYVQAGALRFGDYGPLLYGPHPVRADGTAEWVGYAHGAEWLVRDVGADVQRAEAFRPDAARADGYWAEGRRRQIRVVRESAAPVEMLGPTQCAEPLADAWPVANAAPTEFWRGAVERATWRAAAVTHHLTIAVEQLAPTTAMLPTTARAVDAR
ncbi:MAG TPA: hypothetical protein VGD56_22750 [Gemmatirosa sp.]